MDGVVVNIHLLLARVVDVEVPERQGGKREEVGQCCGELRIPLKLSLLALISAAMFSASMREYIRSIQVPVDNLSLVVMVKEDNTGCEVAAHL